MWIDGDVLHTYIHTHTHFFTTQQCNNDRNLKIHHEYGKHNLHWDILYKSGTKYKKKPIKYSNISTPTCMQGVIHPK